MDMDRTIIESKKFELKYDCNQFYLMVTSSNILESNNLVINFEIRSERND